jgi:hypothetical protein
MPRALRGERRARGVARSFSYAELGDSDQRPDLARRPCRGVVAVCPPDDLHQAIRRTLSGYLMYQWAARASPTPLVSKPLKGVVIHVCRTSALTASCGTFAKVNSAPLCESVPQRACR